MEDFGACATDPKSVCIEKASSCDVFVGIVGQRYGSCPPGDDRSMTEIEYDSACSAGVPRFMFVAPEEFAVPAHLIESDEKRARLAAFRQRVLLGDTVKGFKTDADLTAGVLQAFHNCREMLLSHGSTQSLEHRSYLLFPYAICRDGYDTGIAVVNAGAMPFGTRGDSGVCTIHYYGSAGAGVQPAPQSSCVVRPGATLTYILLGGGSNGLNANLLDSRGGGFRGYLVVECHFRYAHGFASITQVLGGANAQGQTFSYIATEINPDAESHAPKEEDSITPPLSKVAQKT